MINHYKVFLFSLQISLKMVHSGKSIISPFTLVHLYSLISWFGDDVLKHKTWFMMEPFENLHNSRNKLEQPLPLSECCREM